MAQDQNVISLMLHISGYNGLSYLKSSQIIFCKVDLNYLSYRNLLGTQFFSKLKLLSNPGCCCNYNSSKFVFLLSVATIR